jgi:anti-sigma factor RsiW
MSSFQHPEDGLLLRFIDGELPGWKSRQVRRHLEACWQCRESVEELQGTVAECIRYRKQIQAYIPAPPKAWPDLSREFARIDASFGSEPFWKRSLAFPMLRQAALGAAALALLCAVIYQFRMAPAVEASVLLKRAVAAETLRPAALRAVRIHTASFEFKRTVGTRAVAQAPMPVAVESLFAEARYNAEDPLSARSYRDWHDGLAGERDDPVSTVADPQSPAGSCYRIHTVAATGAVAGATLLLSTGDLRPVEGRLEFRDREWIEFTEIMEPPAGGGTNTAGLVEVPVRPVVPSRPAAVVPGASASISDQIGVLSELHQIGADLGDPVEVTLSDGKVMVGGVGVSPQVQRRIHEDLDSKPNVSVQFSEPQTLSAGRDAGTQDAASSPAGTVQTRLEDQLGGRAEFQRFSATVLKSNETVMSRAYALRNLAEKFPVEIESGLSANDRRVLRDMLRDHLSQLSKQAADVQSLLMPSLTVIGATVQARRPAEGTGWQSSVEEVLRASQLVEVRLSALLGVTPGQNSTSTQLPSEVLTALADLRVQVDRCSALVNQ